MAVYHLVFDRMNLTRLFHEENARPLVFSNQPIKFMLQFCVYSDLLPNLQ